MLITEIYRSIQGESSYAGWPCIFVRLTGCNLRCCWCDSEYTFTGGRRLSLEEVMAEVRGAARKARGEAAPPGPGLQAADDKREAGGKSAHLQSGPDAIQIAARRELVEITGGEPMLQAREVVALMERLLNENYVVLLETSGERLLEKVPPEVIKIVDVKCPGSGEGETFNLENLQWLTPQDEFKFVLAGRADYEFARNFLRLHQLDKRAGSVIFSPAFSKTAAGARDASQCLLDPSALAAWILEDGLQVRMGLQLHKFIWDPAAKGV